MVVAAAGRRGGLPYSPGTVVATVLKTEESPSNLATVRGAYEAWARGDVDRLVEAFSTKAEIHPYLGATLGASAYHGHAGVRRWFADANDAWESLTIEVEEILDGGDVVVVALRAVGVGKGSHAEVEARILHLLEFEDGKAIRLRGYGDRGKALRDAGIGG
jgi:ketosteroid isomerase-like protein